MMPITIKQLDRLCLVLLVAVSLICGYVTVSRIMKIKRQFGVERNILSKRMKEVNLAASNLQQLKANLTAVEKELGYLNERIPPTGKIGLLLTQVNALMKQRRITLISLEPLPVKQDDHYLKNPVQLVFSGRFNDIFHLIRDLEKMNRLVIMETLTISKQEKSDFCQVELLANVFERLKAA
jgi:Tfp pilus assembly protein PilO